MPMTVFMTFELAAYGACSGGFSLLFGKISLSAIWNIYLSMVSSMVAGDMIRGGLPSYRSVLTSSGR